MKFNALKNHLVILFILLIALPGCSGKARKPHILLITIDTLRRDHLGFYGYQRDTSPYIDSLAKEGLVFKNTITPLPLTDGSHASILTGLHPLVHGVINNATPLPDEVETIAETFKNNGYYTIGTTSVYHLNSKYNFDQGFDSFSDSWDKTTTNNLDWLRVAESVNKSLFKQIEKYKKKHNDKPLFIWVHYYDPHTPYINWKDINLRGKKINNTDIDAYDKEIRYTNNAIKELHNFLEKKDLKKDLITCITADHGEQLGEHGVFGEHSDFYTENTFVPFVLHGNTIPKGIEEENYYSTMDIAPTLLGLAGLSFNRPIEGLNLLDSNNQPKPTSKSKRDFLLIANPRFVRSLQWIKQPYSYILNRDHVYKFWYVTDTLGFPEDRFQPVKQQQLEMEYLKKSDKYAIYFHYPYTIKRGLQYGVLRFDIIKDAGISFGFDLSSEVPVRFSFQDKKVRTVTAYFPITELDQLIGVIYKKKETEIDHIRYAIVPAEKIAAYLHPGIEHKNPIFKLLMHRKNLPGDELYNLSEDFPMLNNMLLQKGNVPPQVIEGQKAMYRYLKRYLKESKQLSKSPKGKKKLTDKEKEMLKSLGYL
jgi:arylsulfatase A-like enzyme